MGIFGLLGSMFMGIIFFGVLIVLVLVSWIVSGYRRMRGSRNNQYNNQTGYSTGGSSQRYAYAQQNQKQSRWGRRNTYDGPTAKRTYSSSQKAAAQSAGGNEVVEIPILEVTDLPDDESK